MMANPNPRTSGANDDELPGGTFTTRPTTQSKILLGIDIVSHRVTFTMNNSAGLQSTGHTDADGHFIFLDRGEYVEFVITLDSAWQWTFDAEPITFKTRQHAKNYKLASVGLQELVLWAKSTRQASATPPKGDKEDHGFNLYLMLDQTGMKRFPVRLDPDLKNPPPPPGLFQPTSGPVPIV